MNIMTRILLPCVVALFASGQAVAEKVNSKESLRLCKSAMEEKKAEGSSLKFKRNSATSVDMDRYKHWINLVEINGSKKTVKKLLCETSRSGDILVLDIRDGKWKI